MPLPQWPDVHETHEKEPRCQCVNCTLNLPPAGKAGRPADPPLPHHHRRQERRGRAPIKTARGWLHIAHGVRNTAAGLRYVIYLFVTDLKEPWKVIAEPAGFLIAPRGWERVSDVSNVVFTNGAIADDDGKVYIYYAATDTRLHVASTTIGQLLDFAFKTPADPLRSRDCVAQRVALIEKNQAYLNQQDR